MAHCAVPACRAGALNGPAPGLQSLRQSDSTLQASNSYVRSANDHPASGSARLPRRSALPLGVTRPIYRFCIHTRPTHSAPAPVC